MDRTGLSEVQNPKEANQVIYLDLKEYKKGVLTNMESEIYFAMKVSIGL